MTIHDLTMAGHSKWANIKHKKAVNDSRKAVVFSKLARLITLAVTSGGGNPDPASNIKLRIAVERARAENMPKLNIDRAIEKAAGPDGASLKEIVYEAFGPGGVGMLIVATTDNPNRTNSVVRMVLDKHGAKMAGVNSVAYMFAKSFDELESNYKPHQYVDVDAPTSDRIETILEVLEGLDDVDTAYSNYRTRLS